MRGATNESWKLEFNPNISTHAPRERCDVDNHNFTLNYYKFLLTHLVRGATECDDLHAYIVLISTHAPRERCDNAKNMKFGDEVISTHAPRERCDFLAWWGVRKVTNFYSRTS